MSSQPAAQENRTAEPVGTAGPYIASAPAMTATGTAAFQSAEEMPRRRAGG